MASASQRKATFISQKLKFLKDQGDLLIGAVGQYVSGIIEAGESWTEGGDNNMGYLELCQMIDTEVEFLWKKCEELAAPPASTIFLKQQSPQASTTSHKQLSPPASTTSHRQVTQTVQPAEDIQLKPVLARIAVMEEALYSVRSNAENVAEQQSGIDQQMKDLLSKLLESDKKNNSMLRKVKEQISEISDTQSALDQEQEARLQSLEKQLQKLSTAQDRMEVEIESQVELTEKHVHVADQLESVKEDLDVIEARIDGIGRIIDDYNNKHLDIEQVLRDLAEKVMANTGTVQVISEGQDQKTTLLRELETRIQTLEAENGRNVKDVQKQAYKRDASFRMLSQMLNDRLTPLEQLRTSLNQQVSARDDNIRKLSQVIQEVAVMAPRLQQLEVKSCRTRCGFSAWTSLWNVAGNSVIQYKSLDCNVGGHFDADSGIFTAPVDGLYVAYTSLYLWENEGLHVDVRYDKQGLGQSSSALVCWSSAEVKGTTACSVGVVDMKAGDTLYSFINHNKTDYDKLVYFSCFLLT